MCEREVRRATRSRRNAQVNTHLQVRGPVGASHGRIQTERRGAADDGKCPAHHHHGIVGMSPSDCHDGVGIVVGQIIRQTFGNGLTTGKPGTFGVPCGLGEYVDGGGALGRDALEVSVPPDEAVLSCARFGQKNVAASE